MEDGATDNTGAKYDSLMRTHDVEMVQRTASVTVVSCTRGHLPKCSVLTLQLSIRSDINTICVDERPKYTDKKFDCKI